MVMPFGCSSATEEVALCHFLRSRPLSAIPSIIQFLFSDLPYLTNVAYVLLQASNHF